MATKSGNPVPAGMSTMTTQLFYNGNCKEAIEFYKKAFNAEMIGPAVLSPDGKLIWHAVLKIGDSLFMLNDTLPGSYEQGPGRWCTAGVWLYVDDADKWYNRAMEAGGTMIMEMSDTFWGDRMGKVKDPFGHCWDIATRVWDYTAEEMQVKQDEFLAAQKKK
jgi:PhnB protein